MKEKKMAHKRLWLGMLLMALAFAVTLGGCNKKPQRDGTEADVPAWMNVLPPEDALWGIGIARTESDGESILLAEDRARTNIARQVDANVYSIIAEDQAGDISVDFSQMTTSTVLIGSRVLRRYKDSTGAWWCLAELQKGNAVPNLHPYLSGTKPAQIDSAAAFQSDIEIFRSNRENWPDIKNAVTLPAIPGWVFDYNAPEDMICGVGAAKLADGEEAVRLAMERARRSLARSLSAEINTVFSDYIVSESESYQEEGVSITSIYEYTPIQTLLLDQAKTKDGTLWVMLGIAKPAVQLPTSFNAEERLNQILERLTEEAQQ